LKTVSGGSDPETSKHGTYYPMGSGRLWRIPAIMWMIKTRYGSELQNQGKTDKRQGTNGARTQAQGKIDL